ncbi:cell division protein FtsQ/DivIB [Henriciella sp.]|uniref:cell division protein FtsQ/DivIB n=1 Tax=Henriciella sp. TaxID=1968823 RepID=UPI002625CD0A|nr:cell division protein FtsQ/DivIB [Henriciella sp.]
MPQVKGKQQKTGKTRQRKAPPPEPEYARVDTSSVVFGLVMVLAVIVAGAALMGGSLSKIDSRFQAGLDTAAAAAGFAVADVKVVGLEMNTGLEGRLRQVSGVEPGENMFRADPHVIRRRVVSAGHVSDARVYRLWPDQILIHASPARPVALWHNGENWKVVDSLGRTMEGLDPQAHASLLRLSGAAAPEGTEALLRVVSQNQGLLPEISYAQRVSKRRWDIKLRNGTTIQLPADSHIDSAAVRLAEIESEARLTARDVGRIDLRVPGKVYLKPEGSQGAGSAPAES